MNPCGHAWSAGLCNGKDKLHVCGILTDHTGRHLDPTFPHMCKNCRVLTPS